MTIAAHKALADGSALDLVAAELGRVEARIAEVIGSREQKLTDISRYLIDAGGKRVRPAVSMLVFRACGGEDITDIVDLSVSLELIHTATLLHDDIIDSNDTRRGKAAAPLRFGIADTLVAGDFLFSRAFEVCGRFEAKIVAWAADACVQLTEGEIMQGRFRRHLHASEDDYREIITRKTASLFAAGTRIAAYLAGMDERCVTLMRECGHEIGLAFQMIDDVLDVQGDASRTGKRVGTDLIDGNPSLPIVWGLDLPAVRKAFTTVPAAPATVADAIQAIRDARLPERVRNAAAEHAARAVRIIETLEPSPYRDGLCHLAAELVERDL